jgi:hypothetical protein
MQRGAARAREPAFVSSASHDGEAEETPSERSPGWAERASGDGHGQPRAGNTTRRASEPTGDGTGSRDVLRFPDRGGAAGHRPETTHDPARSRPCRPDHARDEVRRPARRPPRGADQERGGSRPNGDPRQHGAPHEAARADGDRHRRAHEDQRQHRQLGGDQRRADRAAEAPHGRPLRRRHRDGSLHRQGHRHHPPGDHRRLAGADRHRADLPDARGTRRRHRRHEAAALPRHVREAGEAGGGLHDRPRRPAPGAPPPHDGPDHRDREPGRLADRPLDDDPQAAESALHPLRGSLRHLPPVRRDLEPGRRPPARQHRRRQRRGSSRNCTCSASSPAAPGRRAAR